MKRTTLILLSLCTLTIARGQVAQWLIPPAYEKMYFPEEADVIVTDSAQTTTLWSRDGKRLATTSDTMYPFSEGFAVTSRPNDAFITAIYDKNGLVTTIKDYQLGRGYPFFHDGHLLVHDGYNFRFMDTKGNVDAQEFIWAYPFFGGYSSCYTYENMKKKKSPFNLLIDKNLQQVPLLWNGKPFDAGDVEFISSVNDEGLGIIVAKHKLYYFIAETRELRPVYASAEETSLKNQAKMESDMVQSFVVTSDSTKSLTAKCGKNGWIEITFDDQLRPISFAHDEEIKRYKEKAPVKRDFPSMLKKYLGEDGKLALYWDDHEILPPQFTRIPLCFDDKAFIVTNGKYGLLRVRPNDNFRLSLNRRAPIAFRHRRFDTTLRLDMPPYISPEETSIEIDSKTGCIIDKPSKETKRTADGNLVQYASILRIPDGITDEVSEISYPAYIVYEGLRSPLIEAKAQAWHYNYYNVDVVEQETSISGGTLAFTFDISAERLPDEDIYPYNVDLATDSLPFNIEKVSALRYKCKVHNLKEGINNVVVQIQEEGCPPASYTFEVEYTKPTARATQDKVVMKKKRKTEQSRPSTPHLEI